MKQSTFDNYRLDAKLALLKEKRKTRNEMRKAVVPLNYGNISEYSRVTAPSSNDVTSPTTKQDSETRST